jgi:hypothetical protein
MGSANGTPILSRPLQERYGLTHEEANRLLRQHGHVLRVLESEFEAFGARPELSRSLGILMRAPDVALSWETLRGNSSEAFVAFVESARSAHGGAA